MYSLSTFRSLFTKYLSSKIWRKSGKNPTRTQWLIIPKTHCYFTFKNGLITAHPSHDIEVPSSNLIMGTDFFFSFFFRILSLSQVATFFYSGTGCRRLPVQSQSQQNFFPQKCHANLLALVAAGYKPSVRWIKTRLISTMAGCAASKPSSYQVTSDVNKTLISALYCKKIGIVYMNWWRSGRVRG